MKIFGYQVEPGTRLCEYVKVGELACFSDIRIPVLVIRGEQAGPTLWLTGAVHGDELNGLWAMRRLFWDLAVKDLRGTLVLTPLLNPMAFLARSKISPLDYLDMDQQFPGNPQGLYSERVAHAVFSELRDKADYVIDFHTLNHLFSATPYTVSKIVPGAADSTNKTALSMTRAFGVYPNCRVDLQSASGELPGATSGALDILCMQHNIPCFMAELGGGGRWDEPVIQVAYEGIQNVMVSLGMLAGEPLAPRKQLMITKRKFLRSNVGGLVRMAVEPGSFVPAGGLLATIYDFWQEVDRVYAEQDLFVIAACFNPVVSSGDRLAFVGYEWHEAE
ncbi:M14 family metallopeptidase [Sporomusa aerivorans]|uniref:M14 family metallopeptidase n=1 Tax=Sporomusa aerivorans TaxID=204936 RepID=UPI00352AF2E0